MARTKKTFPIPLIDSLWWNLKNGKNKEDISYTSLRFSLEEPFKTVRTKKACPIPLLDSLLRNLKNGRTKKTCPKPLFISLRRNLKNGKNKEGISITSLRFSLEEP